MVIRARERIHGHIAEHIVHPAHVPLEVEAEPAYIRRLCYHRPCGGFLGDHHYVGVFAEERCVELLEERHSLEVLMTSVDVWAPLAVLAVVVQVEHGSDSVHAQTVYVVFLYPVVGVGNQEALHLGLAPVEDVGAPVLVFALQRVGVLVAACAVELVQTCRVLGEVGGNPVHYDAYPGGVAPVHELHEVVRSAEAGSRREVSYLLVAPASIVGILADGHELDMGVAHLLNVGNELFGKLAVAQEVLAVLAPGACVHLIYIRGAVVDILCVELFYVPLVSPAEALQLVEFRSGVRAELHVIAVRVGLELYKTVRAFNAVLVVVVLLYAGHEQLPDTAVAYLVHRVAAPVPVVEVADNADRARIRSPYPEHRAGLAVLRVPVGAEELVCVGILALMEKIQRNGVLFRHDYSHLSKTSLSDSSLKSIQKCLCRHSVPCTYCTTMPKFFQ